MLAKLNQGKGRGVGIMERIITKNLPAGSLETGPGGHDFDGNRALFVARFGDADGSGPRTAGMSKPSVQNRASPYGRNVSGSNKRLRGGKERAELPQAKAPRHLQTEGS